MPPLNEKATDDIRRSYQADELRQALVSYLHKMPEGSKLETVTLAAKDAEDGDRAYAIDARDFFGTGYFGDVVILFAKTDYRTHGRAMKFPYKQNGIQYGIVIYLDLDWDQMTPLKIMYQLGRDQVKDTFIHEVQHIIDYKRRKGEIKAKNNTEISTSQDYTNYYNSAAELNAYFHNVAEPLMSRMRWIKKHGTDTIGLYDELPDNFRDFFADRLTHLYGSKKNFWQYLTPENKQRVIKRLNKLYDEYMLAIKNNKYDEYREQ